MCVEGGVSAFSANPGLLSSRFFVFEKSNSLVHRTVWHPRVASRGSSEPRRLWQQEDQKLKKSTPKEAASAHQLLPAVL